MNRTNRVAIVTSHSRGVGFYIARALRDMRAFNVDAPPTTPPADAPPQTPPSDAPPVTPPTSEKPWWDGQVTEQPVVELLTAKSYKSPAELAMAYYNLNKTFSAGERAVVPPGEDATPEQVEEFHKKLGRPDTPDAYDLKFGEGVTVDDGMVKFGKNLFHKMGLSPKQAQVAADMWQEHITADNAARAEAWRTENETAVAKLTERWGADMDANLAAGKRVVQSLGLSADLVSAVEAHIGTAPVVELLAKIGRASDEGGFKGSGTGGGAPNSPANMTKEQADAEVKRLNGDAAFLAKYHDKNHPEHKDAVQRMVDLYARL